jgi:hypothetical protein
LRLKEGHSEGLKIERTILINEAIELKNTMGAIYRKKKSNNS